ncbi:MAG: hypothetical protein J0H64_02835, partial [Actinobacteria bacterium]|nr:hypothetical protein [Actinomycetota bacterium]
KVLAAAEDRMMQLKVERGAVARYFESLGEVLSNAQKMETVTRNATEAPLQNTEAPLQTGTPAESAELPSPAEAQPES